MSMTTQVQVRAAFWHDHPTAQRQKVKSYSGYGKMHCTDTRVAFCDFVESLSRNGQISTALANRVTL